MLITAVSAARVSADLFAAHTGAEQGHTLVTAEIGDCGTVVPHKIPDKNPPPPPPFSELAHFAGVDLPTPTRVMDGWCGTVPHKLPFPPPPAPPPAPWIDGINQMLNSR